MSDAGAALTVMLYCGLTVSGTGSVVGDFSGFCAGFAPAAVLGVRSEPVPALVKTFQRSCYEKC